MEQFLDKLGLRVRLLGRSGPYLTHLCSFLNKYYEFAPFERAICSQYFYLNYNNPPYMENNQLSEMTKVTVLSISVNRSNRLGFSQEPAY
jgi:hypothetical protein